MTPLQFRFSFPFFLFFLFLSGCGFAPLYSSAPADQSAAGIAVAPIDGALGQDLRTKLEHRFNPKGLEAEKNYRLVITLQESEESSQGIRRDDTATRITISLTANYKLYRQGQEVLGDKSYFRAAYNILKDPYSSYVSHQDAVKRLKDLIADDISTRISLYLRLRTH